MRLIPPTPKAEFSLFAPDNTLPTDERTQFRTRADDVFGDLSRDKIVPLPETRNMLPPPPRTTERDNCRVNVTPNAQLYSQLVSDRIPKPSTDKSPKRKRPFVSGGSNFRAQHEITPEKFTKYTLADTDIISDKQNKAVALDFLRNLKKDKTTVEDDDSDKKITFKRRDKNTDEETVQNSNKVHKNAVVQDEYVIGKTKSGTKRNQAVAGKVGESSGKEQPARKQKKPVVSACYLDDEGEG